MAIAFLVRRVGELALITALALMAGGAVVAVSGHAAVTHTSHKKKPPKHKASKTKGKTKPHKSAYTQGRWSGQSLYNGATQLTFTVHGSSISHFVAPDTGCWAVSGYMTTPIAPPRSIPVGSRGSFRYTWDPTAGVKDVLSGKFTRRNTAAGTLQQTGACDTGAIHWIAQVGTTPPALPPAPGPTACAKGTPCQALDGLTLDVLSTDGSVVSNPSPPFGFYDTNMHNGGLEVTVEATNTTTKTVTFQPLYEFTLKYGESVTNPDDDSGEVITGNNGATYNCDNSAATLSPGQTSSPLAICFPVPPAQQQGMQLAYGGSVTGTFATWSLG